MQEGNEVRRSRASLPTMPESDDAREVRATETRASSVPLERPKLTWAVDDGGSVRAMSTFDLWHALANGQVDPLSLVWRMGRECWTSAIEIPELACALRTSLHGEIDATERRTLDYGARLPSFGVRSTRAGTGFVTSDPDLIVGDAELDAIELAAIQREADALFDDFDDQGEHLVFPAAEGEFDDEATPGPTVLESGAPPRVTAPEAPPQGDAAGGRKILHWARIAGAAVLALGLAAAPIASAGAAAVAQRTEPSVPVREPLVGSCSSLMTALETVATTPSLAPQAAVLVASQPEPEQLAVLPADAPPTKASKKDPKLAAKPARRAKSYSPQRSGQKRESRSRTR